MRKANYTLILFMFFPCFSNAADLKEIEISRYHGRFIEIEVGDEYYIALPVKDLMKEPFPSFRDNKPTAYMPDRNTPNQCEITYLCLKCCHGDSKISKEYCKKRFKNQTVNNCGCE